MKSIKPSLERVQLTDTQIKLVMPQKVLDQIKYLCKNIAKVEWSGILFYNVEGSIKDPANMVLTLEDILPMNKGTQAYTEYAFDESVIMHMMDNENLEDCKMGHIHSHNTMGVFFSGTDWSELEDNAPNHNFYLSLIVNNFNEFCAKVCFIAEGQSKEVEFIAKDEHGVPYTYLTQEVNTGTQKLVIYDCAIECPDSTIKVATTFAERVNFIIEKAERVVSRVIPGFTKGVSWANPNSFAQQEQKKVFPSATAGIPHWGGYEEDFFQEEVEIPESKFKKEVSKEKVVGGRVTFKSELEEYQDLAFSMQYHEKMWEDGISKFSAFVMNTGNSLNAIDVEDTEDVIEFYSLRTPKVTPKAVASKVLSTYLESYERFFKKALENLEDEDRTNHFVNVLEGVISEYSYEASVCSIPGSTDYLLECIDTLTKLKDNFLNPGI